MHCAGWDTSQILYLTENFLSIKKAEKVIPTLQSGKKIILVEKMRFKKKLISK